MKTKIQDMTSGSPGRLIILFAIEAGDLTYSADSVNISTITELLFTPFSVTRFAMHRIYANRINSRCMSRDFGMFMPKHLAG